MTKGTTEYHDRVKKHDNKFKDTGRPTEFTQEMADYVCMLIATTPVGLKKLCQMHPDIPYFTTILRWRFQRREFRKQFDEAKRLQAQALAEDCLDIADESEDDIVTNKKGGTKVDYENIQRSKLRIDTRKWMAEKLAPTKWGNQQSQDDTLTAIEQLLKNQEDK